MISAHPGFPEFDYIKPANLSEASQFLASHSAEARPFSGGTDCFVRIRDGFFTPKYLVDIKSLEGTNELKFDPKNGLTVGAAVPMNRVASFPETIRHYPVLVEAIKSVASYQLRNRATIVGNICNASPAGDTIGACMVYNSVLNVSGVDGKKTIPVREFFTGPGKNTLKPGDIVVSIQIPLPPAGHSGKYIKLGRNRLSDLSIVGITALGVKDKNYKSGYRFSFAIASVAPIPFVPVKSEEILASKPITSETINEAAKAAMDSINPIDDVRGSATYRRYMVRNLVKRAVEETIKKLGE
jgi:CO/xanthine dehydrogenase FAD-binding subunit